MLATPPGVRLPSARWTPGRQGVAVTVDGGAFRETTTWPLGCMGSMGFLVWSNPMKTTMNLDDDLLAAVRARAAEQNTTMREVVHEALRRLLVTSDRSPFSLTLPSTQGRRPPTIDVDSNAALDDYLDRAAVDTSRE